MRGSRIAVYGTGGFGREVASLAAACVTTGDVGELIGFVTDEPKARGTELNGLPVIGDLTDLAAFAPTASIVIGVGSPAVRRRLVSRITSAGFELASVIHPSVVIPSSVSIGPGCVIAAGNLLTVNIQLGSCVVLNLACTVGHDCLIDNYVTLAPGVNLSGNVRIGEGTEIGTGAAVIQETTIGGWSIVGAGAVVTRDIPANVTAVGVPAKIVKTREPGWHVR